MTVVRLKPGDPPPFWNGLWQPHGQSQGAVLVRDGVIVAPSDANASPIALPAISASENPGAQTIGGHMATPSPGAPQRQASVAATGVSQGSETTATGASQRPERASVKGAATGPHQPEDTARSWVAQLVSRSVLSRPTAAPVSRDVQQGAALVQQARAYLAQRQWVNALKCLQASLDFAPAQSDTYLLTAQCLQASRASGDALHHALVAAMLNPREVSVQRLAMHYAWVAGYVGWAFHWAQSLHKQAPAAEVADLGRMARAWLTSQPPAHTAFCMPCRKSQLVDARSRCDACQAPLVGAPANAQSLKGLLFLQHGAPHGRLFVGAPCTRCQRDTALILGSGGARCAHCHDYALPVHAPVQA